MVVLSHPRAKRATGDVYERTRGSLEPPLTQVELAYAAGLFDGEGHLRQKNQYGVCAMHVEITSTDLRVLAWMQHRYGGRIIATSKLRGKRRRAYYWRLGTGASHEFLTLVRNFLVIKKAACERAIAEYEAGHACG